MVIIFVSLPGSSKAKKFPYFIPISYFAFFIFIKFIPSKNTNDAFEKIKSVIALKIIALSNSRCTA